MESLSSSCLSRLLVPPQLFFDLLHTRLVGVLTDLFDEVDSLVALLLDRIGMSRLLTLIQLNGESRSLVLYLLGSIL